MAFPDPWDLTTPTATEALKNGDDRIREMKRALDQRLSELIAGWPNTDPLDLKTGDNPTQGGRLLLGTSSVAGAVGTVYSGGEPYISYNAVQTRGADLWARTLPGTDAYLVVFGPYSGQSLTIYKSLAAVANGTFAAFWTPIFSVDVNGSASLAAVATKAQSASGTVAGLANGASSTMFAVPNGVDSVWQVTVRDYGAGAGLELNTSIVSFNDNNDGILVSQLNAAGNLAIINSGFNIQVQNNTGIAKNILWTAVRLY